MKWGILGASKFALDHMARAIHASEGNELVAVASRDVARVEPFQSFAPNVQTFSDYDALLADPNIDAVYIPLPHPMHAEWCVKALNAGKHALAEKPIAMSVADFDAMIDARDKTGLQAAEAYMIVHHPQWQRTKALIADGAIGDLVHVSGAFSYDNRSDPKNIRNDAAMGGGGLRDIGVYTIGSARWVLDADLSNIQSRVRYENGFDTFAEVSGMLGDVTYSTYVSTRMHLHQEMNFHGTDGFIKLTAPFNPSIFGEAQVHIHQPNGAVRVERFPGVNQYKTQVETFAAAAKGGQAFPWTLEDARGTQAALDTIFATAQELE